MKLKPVVCWEKIKKRSDAGRTRYSWLTPCCSTVVSWWYGEKPETCPSCGAKHWVRGGWHEYRLFNLQDQLQEKRTDAVLVEILDVLEDYARIMIASLYASMGASADPITFDEKAMELAYRVYEFILKGAWIRLSFGALMKKIRPGVMFGDADHDKTLSLDRSEDNDNTFLDYAFQKQTDQLLVYEPDHLADQEFQAQHPIAVELKKGVELIVEKVQSNYGVSGSLKMLSGLHAKMTRKPVKFLSSFYQEFGMDTRNNVEKAELIIFKYLVDLRDKAVS